ncbi:MAG: methyltransferase [Bdellovibrionaceae bacterium]|nr:methyltransferase [Pseudobdellovibrionaceae bacterium]
MLHLVATPIGDFTEITFRAIEILKSADVILCESTKETSTLLKRLEIKAKRYEILNEHTTLEDLIKLAEMCKNENVALVSDCGTPGFCDPGNSLINLCRKNKVPVRTVLGASALMGLLSLSSQRINQFLFRGFMPAENETRAKEWTKLKAEKNAIIIMDTPYRLKKTLEEVVQHFNMRDILLVMNLSQVDEEILEGRPSFILQNLKFSKAEFMLMIYPA